MVFMTGAKEKKTFRDIVLAHLSKILEISLDEFKGGYFQKEIKGNYTEEIYIPDSRKRMCQAIEFFSFLLQPHYDKDMRDKAEEIQRKIKENLEDYNGKGKKKEEDEIKKITREEFMIIKLKHMKELFEEINHLLQRKNYLKEEIYQEGLEDMDDEDDEE